MVWKGIASVLIATVAVGTATWYSLSAASTLVGAIAPNHAPGEQPTPLQAATAASPAAGAAPDDFGPVPDVNPKLTRANFDRVRAGMTVEEVTALLGDPTGATARPEAGTDPAGWVNVLRWEQRSPAASVEVEFVDGRCGSKHTTLASPPTFAPAAAATLGRPGDGPPKSLKPIAPALGLANVTRANFDRIENGMTEEEVLAILGPAGGFSTKKGTINGQPFHTRVLRWRRYHPDITITVTFRSEKVSGKNCQQSGPPNP